ncbi:ribosome-recycling factor [Thraustotheca clavata]|uniref:Ribosome-recycling factor n=1 Tax=Thraustotheca clavata TaxID=74557 RepID=A0A1V9YUR2_9STRA|nr:ribosome-recycling factor [Thraustotheca clavata]
MLHVIRNRDLMSLVTSYQQGVFVDVQECFRHILALKTNHRANMTRLSFMNTLTSIMNKYVDEFHNGLLLRLVRCLHARDFAFVMSCVVKFAVAEGHVNLLHNIHLRLSLHQCQYLPVQAAAFGQVRVLSYLHLIKYPQWTPAALLVAAQNRNLSSIKFLQHHYPTSCACQALTEAAKKGYLDVVSMLYNNRHASCPRDKAFDQAVSAGQLEIVKYLFSHGESGTGIGLPLAADHGHIEIVKYLHQESMDEGGPVVMDLAAANGHLDIVKYLHKHTTAGCTHIALREAAMNGHEDVVEFLLKNRSEGNRLLAWKYARRYGYESIATLLEPFITRREQPRRECKRKSRLSLSPAARAFSKKAKGGKGAKTVPEMDVSLDEVSKKTLESVKKNMKGAVLNYTKVISAMRPGQADAGIFDNLMLSAYGQMVPLPQLGQVSVVGSHELAVSIYDPSLLKDAKKAIEEMNPSFTVQPNNTTLDIRFPKMTKETRDELIKAAKKQAEAARQHIRRVRQEGMNDIKKLKDSISEDDIKVEQDKIQRLTDDSIKEIGALLAAKEKDLSSV